MSKEAEPIDYTSIEIACQLCGKWMRAWEYDKHYEKCLDIEYLISIAKEKGENITRDDLKQYPQETIDKLLRKYDPNVCKISKF